MKTFGFVLAVALVVRLLPTAAAAVEVSEGAEGVELKCRADPSNLENLSVGWYRYDLSPPVVHYNEQGTDRFDKQNQKYGNRTSVKVPLREEGHANLLLNKPQISDSGNYTCVIRRFGEELKRTEVQLQVKEPSQQDLPYLLGLLLMALIFAYIVYLIRKTSAVSQVKVKQGAQSVKLSYETTARLPEDAIVEWSSSDPGRELVHRYGNGQDQLENQHHSYKERTEMTNPLQTGDLSLTLSHPHRGDSGIYICTVLRGGDILAQKVVELQVQRWYCTKIRVCQEGAQPVAQLSEDAIVEMNREPTSPSVHQHETGRYQFVNQHSFYQEQTDMTTPLQTEDHSVALSDPHHVFPVTTEFETRVMITQEKVDDSIDESKNSTVRPF